MLVASEKKKLKENGDLLLETYALFSLSTMARVNAISTIKWSQINFDERKVENVMEKGDTVKHSTDISLTVTIYFVFKFNT